MLSRCFREVKRCSSWTALDRRTLPSQSEIRSRIGLRHFQAVEIRFRTKWLKRPPESEAKWHGTSLLDLILQKPPKRRGPPWATISGTVVRGSGCSYSMARRCCSLSSSSCTVLPVLRPCPPLRLTCNSRAILCTRNDTLSPTSVHTACMPTSVHTLACMRRARPMHSAGSSRASRFVVQKYLLLASTSCGTPPLRLVPLARPRLKTHPSLSQSICPNLAILDSFPLEI